MTPEGRVKDAVKKMLVSVGCIPAAQAARATKAHHGWFFMPVGGPRSGTAGIPDFIGHYLGHFFAVETKAPGGKPTALQTIQLDALDLTGARTFVVDSEESLDRVRRWMEQVSLEMKGAL